MGKMNEISIINDYDNIQLMMCEKEDLIQHINYLQGQLQGCQDELTEEIKTLKAHISQVARVQGKQLEDNADTMVELYEENKKLKEELRESY